MEDKLTLTLQDQSNLSIDMADNPPGFELQMTVPSAGTSNYERLKNLPQINGVTLIENKTPADLHIVSENTSAGWDEDRLYIPKSGEICVFSDTGKIKIGDGVVPVVDLPYIAQSDYDAVMDELHEHTQNYQIHVSSEDRERWNNKLNYEIVGGELIFNRL